MNAFRSCVVMILAGMLLSAFAQIPVTGGGGAGLQAIAGTDTLVTVVLKAGAKDPNLKVLKVEGGILTVRTQTGQVTNYRVSDVAEVRVQGEVMKVQNVDLLSDRGMTTEQQEIVEKAQQRATAIFTEAIANQTLRMYAAEVLAVGGVADANSDEAKRGVILARPQAQEYLNTLVNGNDLRTAMSAALHLTNAGLEVPVPDLVQRGLISGDRLVKASAAKLAGLTNDRTAINDLRTMMQDRAANISVPAIIALAHLEERDIVTTLASLVSHRNSDIANAAVYGLEKLGDESTAQLLKAKLEGSEGNARFRIARVLFNLGDPRGGAVLRDELMAVPSLQFAAAQVLALKGDVKGMQFLRKWLNERREQSEVVMLQRAEATHALIKAGDRTHAGVFQDLLRESTSAIQIRVLHLIGDLDVHALLPMLLPTLNGQDPAAALTACQTTIMMAHNDYGERLRRSRI